MIPTGGLTLCPYRLGWGSMMHLIPGLVVQTVSYLMLGDRGYKD